MNNKQKSTLNKIIKTPVPSDIDWKNIESLFIGLWAVKSVRRFLELAGII